MSQLLNKCHPNGNPFEANPLGLSLWRFVQADTFLYHVMLQVSALELEELHGKPNAFHSEVYSRETIQVLRRRVEDPVVAASDQTIWAVATLASLDVS